MVHDPEWWLASVNGQKMLNTDEIHMLIRAQTKQTDWIQHLCIKDTMYT